MSRHALSRENPPRDGAPSPAPAAALGTTFSTTIPPRLDRLGFTRWHARVVGALGVTWILDGLEATLVAAAAPVLAERETLHLSAGEVGFANGCYLLGEVLGALVFGRLADARGRKRLFLVTLALYLVATALSGATSSIGSFAALRLLAGAGLGGEYAAINSAIDELMPARLRGRIALAINGSYWVGVAAGGALTLVLLNHEFLPHAIGWRLIFGLGAVLGAGVLIVRRAMPESPRWLLLRGRVREAEAVVAAIERHAPAQRQDDPEPVRVTVGVPVGFRYIADVLLQRHRRRAALCLALMVAQTFFYNAIFFSYGLILARFYGVPSERVGLYLLPFAAGNFLGPLLLGRLFDTWGRRQMIAATYALSGVLLLLTGALFRAGWLTATTQTVLWCVVFFVASSAASSAYLTVSELFPVELRGMAIALFFAIGTALGGVAAPVVFGRLVQSGSRDALLAGYAVGAGLMLVAGLIAWQLAERAEGRSLEDLAGGAGP